MAKRRVQVEVYDMCGIAAGASGASAGLLHPYSVKGKMMWRGREAMASAMRLVKAAEVAASRLTGDDAQVICWRNGLVRVAQTRKQVSGFRQIKPPTGGHNNGHPLAISLQEAQRLIPGLTAGDWMREDEAVKDTACLWIPDGAVLHPRRYLAALWEACQVRPMVNLVCVGPRVSQPEGVSSESDGHGALSNCLLLLR
eukprot:evm.model.scf_1024.1 EVM.evm.TU.scf_1024.1   scf_1024:6397-9038(+)